MGNIEIFDEIMKRYSAGEFGEENLSLHDILEKSGNPRLLDEMSPSEIRILAEKSTGFSKYLYLLLAQEKNV